MDNIRYIALSRQMGLWKQMDTLSNNMANMNTGGFKAQDTLFSTYVQQTPKAEGIGREPVYFTQDFANFRDFAEGPMAETGNPLDLAISGEGFFAVDGAAGEQYTRKGQFHLDADRKIVTSEGLPVLSAANAPIFIAPNEMEIAISATGEVSTENGVIGQIKLVDFADKAGLQAVGDTMFANPDAAANAAIVAENASVHQGVVEKSNVNAVEQMTRLISVQRSYEFVQQMIDGEHERLSNAISTFSQTA